MDDFGAEERAEAANELTCLALIVLCTAGLIYGLFVGTQRYKPAPAATIQEATKRAQTIEECWGQAEGLGLDPEKMCAR